MFESVARFHCLAQPRAMESADMSDTGDVMSRTRLGFRRIKFNPDNDPRLMAESALEFDAASSVSYTHLTLPTKA